MKRIALMTPSLTSGGAERVVSIWSSELSKLSDQIFLIITYRTEQEYETYADVKKIYLYESYAQSKQVSIFSKIKKMRSVFKENNIDVVIPFIAHTGMLATAASMFLKTDVIETVRNNPGSRSKNICLRLPRKISIALSKRCIVQNEEQKACFSERVQKKIAVFSNPLHPSVTQIEKEYKTTLPLVFMTAGRLEKQKNHKLLCDAFKLAVNRCPDIELKIYGAGSMQREMEQYIDSIGMQGKIALCGRTNNIAETLSEADAFILSSDHEGMPNALLEAMATGLPCISTDCPTGPSEMIVNGKSGLLVPVGDAESMAAAIVKIASDYKAAIEMGKNAREFAVEQYEASNSAKRLLRFIEEI